MIYYELGWVCGKQEGRAGYRVVDISNPVFPENWVLRILEGF